MKKKTKIIWVIIAVLIFSPMACHFYWMTRGFLEPDIVKHGLERYRKLPSERLIKKLHSVSPYNAYTALDVLAERKETKAVPYIIKMLKSIDKYKRDSAMRALAKIGDPRAIEPLMEIAKKGESNPDYHMALSALSDMKYEGAFPYVIKWAQREDGYRNGSIYMLENFGKPECVPLLEKIRIEIRKYDPGFEFRIDKAIKHIESLKKTK